ncbi:ATP-binding protein [Hahella sp. CR1]|uniref:ATP-binding protein n=1 Tax=Hahella sp. CR1 TaxID=2992807 RepID=UPI0024428E0A|nr:ATP-binding protein [Hahella sp. CR1]MDG9669583.1 ATP-binding protein [Hahella sp. CR1]
MIHPQTRVSEELFVATAAAKKSYFHRGFVLKHSSLARVFEEVKLSLQEHTGKHIIVVAGPTGVGKTTLASRLVDHVYQDIVPDWAAAPHCIPAICVELNMEAGIVFDWKELYRQVLEELEEPLIDRKCHVERISNERGGRVLTGKSAGAAALRNQMKRALKDRETQVIVIDELQHLFKHGGRSEQHYEVLKSLSSKTGCTIIGLGTYELSGMIDWSGQINRIASYVQFPQYKFATQEDQQTFFNAYNGLLAHTPIDLDAGLMQPDLTFFYVGSCGCVGILKDWVYRALSRALAMASPVMTLEHFEITMLSPKALKRILEEIREGEESFRQPDYEEIKQEALGHATGKMKAGSVPQPNAKVKKKGGKPGYRNPVRDPAYVS